MAACGASEEPQGDLGSLGVALVAVGTDGATYRLTPGTSVFVSRTSPQFFWTANLDGSSSVVKVQLPPGTYDATLDNPNGYTTSWPLERTDSSGTTTVNADLVTTLPAPVTVTANSTTSLVFDFKIPSGGTVRFDRGNLDVSIDVGTQPASRWDASFAATDQTMTGVGTSGSVGATLASRLPASGTGGLGVSVAFELVGAWQEGGGGEAPGIISICAPVNVTAHVGTGSNSFADLMAEAGHGSSPGFLFGPASLCVFDNGLAIPEQIRFRMSRTGAGETATFADIGEDLGWFHTFVGDLSERVYDYNSATFDLDALARQSGNIPMRGRVRVLDATGQNLYYQGQLNGTMSFSFAGHI